MLVERDRSEEAAMRAESVPHTERYDEDEARFLSRFVTNTDSPVFCLINLPEVVKGALFARYSRSRLSLRRLMLDEFREDLENAPLGDETAASRYSEALYRRIFSEYGDDSVAQLGSAHVALEGFSNIVIKQIEHGRLMSYLEQSTRYIPYTDRPGGRWRYHVPRELAGASRTAYIQTMDQLFETYSDIIPLIEAHITSSSGHRDPDAATRRAIRARALDAARGLLPAATRSNLGIHGSGQAFEHLLIRLRASHNQEALMASELLLAELRKVIPAFLSRVDREDRGVAWSAYLSETNRDFSDSARAALPYLEQVDDSAMPVEGAQVALIDHDPHGEAAVLAAALYSVSDQPEAAIRRRVEEMSGSDRASLLNDYFGRRTNRRQKPGRALERSTYTFDIVGDYGSFRDLQRHRMLSIEWQPLGVALGFDAPSLIHDAGLAERWYDAMTAARTTYERVVGDFGQDTASYGVPMAFKIRYYMHMNARELMHVAELRSAPQGHDNYRWIVQQMVDRVRDVAGHHAIADAMTFVDRSTPVLGREAAEKRRPRG